MRLGIIIGVVLGFLLTVGGAYTYDALSGRADTGAMTSSASAAKRPMVNWDVVRRHVHDLHVGLIEVGGRVQDEWRKLSG